MTGLVQKATIRGTLQEMNIGDSIGISVDIVKSSTLRATASTLGLELMRRYEVHLDRGCRMFKVTRHE